MTLTLNPGRGELFRGVGDMGRRQKFLLAKDARITIEDSSMRQNDRVLHKIVVEQPAASRSSLARELRKMRPSSMWRPCCVR